MVQIKRRFQRAGSVGSLFHQRNLDKDDPSDYGEVKRARDARVALMVTAPTKQQQVAAARDGDALGTNVGA